jgi:hypothetical protein
MRSGNTWKWGEKTRTNHTGMFFATFAIFQKKTHISKRIKAEHFGTFNRFQMKLNVHHVKAEKRISKKKIVLNPKKLHLSDTWTVWNFEMIKIEICNHLENYCHNCNESFCEFEIKSLCRCALSAKGNNLIILINSDWSSATNFYLKSDFMPCHI